MKRKTTKRVTQSFPIDAIPPAAPKSGKGIRKTVPLEGFARGIDPATQVELKMWGITFSGTVGEVVEFLAKGFRQ